MTQPDHAPIGELRGQAYVELLEPLWSYLVVSEEPVPGEVIFTFGCGDLRVPQRAANLQLDGWASRVLVSGGAGGRTAQLFGASEAEVFARHLRWLGVPSAAIVAEDRAGNTGENVRFGMRALARAGVRARRALLVAKPFCMRRCAATFRLWHPRVETICCPPAGQMPDFAEGTRPAFAARLVAELERLERYPRLGYIAPEPRPVPRRVTRAAAEVRRLLGTVGVGRILRVGGVAEGLGQVAPVPPAGAGAGLSGAARPPEPPARRPWRRAAAG